MTIAVTVKVHDGIVVASDSATTMTTIDANGKKDIVNIYNNANKIFNLVRGLPVGAVTAGNGSMGHASIATLAKELRRRLSGKDPQHKDWEVDPESFTIEGIATRAKEFLYDERWLSAYGSATNIDDFHFWVFGISSNAHLSELWKINISKGVCSGPDLARSLDQGALDWAGQPEAISRLVLGFSPLVEQHLTALGKTPAEIQQFYATMTGWLTIPLASDPMPIIDAIELAEFLVETTIKFSRFNVGAATVGGPVEVAAITRHEGFKWVRRKHYYSPDLNPEATHGE